MTRRRPLILFAGLLTAGTIAGVVAGLRIAGPTAAAGEQTGAPAAASVSPEPSGSGGLGTLPDPPVVTAPPAETWTRTPPPTFTPKSHPPKPAGPKIAYFRIAQEPRCAGDGADAVPLIIEWRITGAEGGDLSVDDPTGTPGTYGPVGARGSQEFPFSCGGEAGSTETHTYDLYTPGDHPKSAHLTASATIPAAPPAEEEPITDQE